MVLPMASPHLLSPESGHPEVDIEYVDGEAYDILVRGHRVRVDQPADTHGADSAPTPTELFIGSLAACVAFYAGRYLTRHGLGRDGLRVRAAYTMAGDRPARVTAVRISVQPPRGFPRENVPALQAVASHCIVHNSLTEPPEITVSVA